VSVMPEQEQAQLDALAIAIRQRAEQAFEEMLQRIRDGETPRAAIDAVTAAFAGMYFAELSSAFSAVLQKNIGISEIKAWPVGDIDLSSRLYRHLDEVNAVTRTLIANHAKGFVQARDLAMQIYEGYGFKDDPLVVMDKLPRYLREALEDPAVSQGFAQIVGRIRASNLKTPALKASYLQAIDALEAGAGENRIKRLVKVAWFERNRYLANRIAQTELHRAYSNQVAQEIMDDSEVVWVKVQMSRTHPRVDICDYHSGLNAWGQGPGVYPKAKAPKPPYHPFCRCVLVGRYDIDADAQQRENPNVAQSFMQGKSDYDQRLIAGSRERLNRFRDGESLEAIYNGSTKSQYRWKTVGDELARPTNSAYELAKSGGEHSGFLKQYLNVPSPMIQRGIKSMSRRINEHLLWMENPYSKLPIDVDSRSVQALVNKKWPKDVARITAERSVLQGILDDREKKNGKQ